MADFLGRNNEIKQLTDWANDHRLVSIVGPGGVGKTRLVQEYLRTTDGLFVDLAPAPDNETATQIIREKIGGGSRWLQTLKQSPRLVVLDNAEHVLDVAFDAIDQILKTNSQVIVTTREPLNHDQERVLHLKPLSKESTEQLLRNIIRRRDLLTEQEVDGLDFSKIHARLDGLPLAVEIVAPRLAIVDSKDRSSFLDEGEIGSHTKRGIARRHLTLQNAFDWSWDGLHNEQRKMLANCSVFPEPFSRAAVCAVSESEDIDQILVDLLSKSLIQRIETSDGIRFGMLFTIRRAAAQKLGADEEVRALERMAVFFIDQTFDTPRYERWKLSDPWLPLRIVRQKPIQDVIKLRVFRALRTLWESTWRAGFEEWEEVQNFLGDRFPLNADALLLRAEAAARERDSNAFETCYELLVDHHDVDHEMILQLNIFASWYISQQIPELESRLWDKMHDATPERRFVFKLVSSMGHTYRSETDEADRALHEAEEQIAQIGTPSAFSTMYATRALSAWRHEKPDESANYFERASSTDWELSVAHASTYVGILRRVGRTNEAKLLAHKTYERAVRAAALIPLSTCAWELFLLGEGIESLETALLYVEGGVASTIWFRIGLAARSSQTTERAVTAFSRALEHAINPGQSGLAQCLLMLLGRSVSKDVERVWNDTFWEEEIAFVKRVETGLSDASERETLKTILNDPNTRYERRFQFEYEKMLAQVDLSDLWLFVLEEFREDRPTLVVERSGNMVRLPNGETLDLSRRGPMKRILVALVGARLVGDDTLGPWDVWEIGWPGETIDPKSATARIYTTINTMRKIGLRDIVCTVENGYAINGDLAVELVDSLD